MLGSGTVWMETAPDSAYVRATCNASLERDVTGFVGSGKESNHVIIVREAPLESVNHEKRGHLNFLLCLKYKRPRYRHLAARHSCNCL